MPTWLDWLTAELTVAIGAAVISVASVVVAVVYGRRQVRIAEEAKDAAVRSAKAAEEQVRVAKAALPAPPPPVGWEVRSTGATPSGSQRWALMNVGTEVAEEVEVDTDRARTVIVEEDTPLAPVRPGASISLLSVRCYGDPVLREVWVRWRGQAEWVAVPLPPDRF